MQTLPLLSKPKNPTYSVYCIVGLLNYWIAFNCLAVITTATIKINATNAHTKRSACSSVAVTLTFPNAVLLDRVIITVQGFMQVGILGTVVESERFARLA